MIKRKRKKKKKKIKRKVLKKKMINLISILSKIKQLLMKYGHV
jgi:hypothetical protein